MRKLLFGIGSMLFAGVLWLGCGETDTCERDNIGVDQACEIADDCPACGPVCSGNGFEADGPPQCEGSGLGGQCVCPCVVCYER